MEILTKEGLARRMVACVKRPTPYLSPKVKEEKSRKLREAHRRHSQEEKRVTKVRQRAARIKYYKNLTEEEKLFNSSRLSEGQKRRFSKPGAFSKLSALRKKDWAEGKFAKRKPPSKGDGWEKWVAGRLSKMNIVFESQVDLKTGLGIYVADFHLLASDEYLEIKASRWENDKQKAKIEELRGSGYTIHYLVNEQIGAWLDEKEVELNENTD